MEEYIGMWLDSYKKVVDSSINFHYKEARVLYMWVSAYCRTVEYPRSIDQKSSIPRQHY